MTRYKKTRIQNANKYLPFFLKENEEFYVGILFEDFLKCNDLPKYALPSTFRDNHRVTPLSKGSSTNANINGKYGRKQPEEKETKVVHIKYIRKKDSRLVEFDRNYHVYIKELQHRYNMPLSFRQNKHGQKVIVSNILKFDTGAENLKKNTHVINLFCEIFNDFEIFNKELEPAIHFNKKFEQDLLPQGNLNNKSTFDEIIKFAGQYTKNDEEQKAFQKRLHVLQHYDPDIRGKGPNNFFGYIVFGFTDLNIVILETMYAGNATYVFKLKDYEEKILIDKQSALKDKSLIKRFFHYDNWEDNVRTFLELEKNKK